MADSVDVDSLQRQLKERIEALDKQRQEEAERFRVEAAARQQLADLERRQQIATYEEAARKREQKRLEVEVEEQKRLQAARATQIALENSLAAAEVARQEQEAKLQWLIKEINNQEFIEEQHKKAMQSATVEPITVEENTEINVEHPVAPDNLGNAVKQTEGSTPDTPFMSTHLKHILRQSTRTY